MESPQKYRYICTMLHGVTAKKTVLILASASWIHFSFSFDTVWCIYKRELKVLDLACCDRGFKSHLGHGCLSVVSVVCCQVEVSATSWSLVQRSPTDCGSSLCVIKKPRTRGGYSPARGLQNTNLQWVVATVESFWYKYNSDNRKWRHMAFPCFKFILWQLFGRKECWESKGCDIKTSFTTFVLDLRKVVIHYILILNWLHGLASV